ncbi:MAG: 30S ribosomal protein S12 methylthiotransferase RimO [Candidatus Wallbacteria bacterium HGW-Wallbacteria-1]|jgi:ribosomal protein S12 methylthiotransferase|uniref:Ribosomal protein uS12 methylthiotransferase RimO n=1 Tax=Candidatus Wallbacteria bacterium HGW-Wallbacteria-1 TaxID=2013854 RepID=A0A2N1PR39_9BACT|nr:MAG: 30S ribosomal protein S12 methylthiotransferase RimO [Candidatus Wallbacteria bacterium HGW-Wallbacteria-1]
MKIFFQSLGCPKNQVDSELMLHSLIGGGHLMVDEPDGADLAIVNTCCFIEEATQETIDTITELLELKARGMLGSVVVAGCFVGRYREELMNLLPDVDLFTGPGTGDKLASLIEGLKTNSSPRYFFPEKPIIEGPRVLANSAAMAYLRISEGCSRHCTYCVIPSIRGSLMSREPESIVSEARSLAGQGVKELVIIAEDSSAYGSDLPQNPKLSDLLAQLDKIEGIEWIRLLYLYPEGVTPELISVIKKSSRILPYLDIPFQHASPKILRLMGRNSKPGDNLELITRLRTELPELIIRSSFITGFPGETKKDFLTLRQFIENGEIDRVGVFEYSREDGTPAADFPCQTRKSTREARRCELMEMAAEMSLAKNKKLIGKKINAIVEGALGHGLMSGRIWSQAPTIDGNIEINGASPDDIDSIICVEITEADYYDLKGRKITSQPMK